MVYKKSLRAIGATKNLQHSSKKIEFMLDLPWADFTEDDFDLKRAKRILDKDHYGLTKVKNRILEYEQRG